MAAEANVLHDARHFGVEALHLTRQLREKYRIAASQPHRRGSPGCQRRQIDQAIAMRVRLGHVELEPGAAGVMTTEALARGQERIGRIGTFGPDPGVVVSFGRHTRDGLIGRHLADIGLQRGDHVGVRTVERFAKTRVGIDRQNDGLVQSRCRRSLEEILCEIVERLALLTRDILGGCGGEICGRRVMPVHAVWAKPMLGRLLLSAGRAGQSGVQPLWLPKPYQPQNQPS